MEKHEYAGEVRESLVFQLFIRTIFEGSST